MRTYIQPGDALTLDAPAAVSAGDGVLAGQLFGVCFNDAAEGEPVTVATTGVYDMSKVSTDALSVGDAVFWKAADGVVTSTASGNTRIGIAVSAAANPSPSVHVRLDG